MTTATSIMDGAAETNERTGATIGAATRNSDQKKATVGAWIGRVMSGLVIAFLLLASAFPKLFMPELAAESMQQLGWNTKHLLVIAIIEVVGTLLYAIPHGGRGRGPSDWPPRGRGRYAPSDRQSIAQPHPVSALRGCFDVGRALAAQRGSASALAARRETHPRRSTSLKIRCRRRPPLPSSVSLRRVQSPSLCSRRASNALAETASVES